MATSKEFYDGSVENQLTDSSEKFERRLCAMEYETEFYGFSPFVYYNVLKTYTSNRIKTVLRKQGVTMSKQLNDAEIIKCQSATENLIQKTDTRVEQAFEKIESKFLNVFTIPPNILLSEDEIQRKQYTEEDVKQIDAEIQDLEKRFKRCLCLESFLKEELEESMALDNIEKELMKVEDRILNKLNNKLLSKLESWKSNREILNDYYSLRELFRKVVVQET